MTNTNLMELLEKGMVSRKELENIELHEDVTNCEYMGLEFGHDGNYLFHVTANNEEYEITVDKHEYEDEAI